MPVVSNPKKVRKIEALIGEKCRKAFSRFFENQNELIVFGVSSKQYVVNLRSNTVENYHDPTMSLGEQFGGIHFDLR
jgi:hypothetical protein